MLITFDLFCVYEFAKINTEARNLGYSMKNIPVLLKQHCLKSMMKKVERKLKIES